MPLWTGYNAPFLNSGSVLPIQHDEKLIKNDLIQLLLTNYGERVMKPYLGTPIKSLTFETIVDSDISTLKSEIVQSIVEYEPRVTIKDILIQVDNDESTITITLFGSVNLNPSDQFKIDIGVSNGDVTFVRAQ